MNLNCLTCRILRRTDSDDEERGRFNNVDYNNQELSNFNLCLARVERSWSGNLAPNSGYDNMMTRASNDGAHRRQNNSGPMEFPSVTPRLQRSPGLRRDWSFENLCRQMKEG
ncbi:hypothetical protein P3L10_000906 [Capsicum annuum]|uniref:uncharacterized protein LOC107871926 n=1 Tax=Capsicum annuum TaxID=4072 RepID=UPI0007BEBFEF|nr:uncharacterized protein LOC107871926 [Capsicum annuum]